MWCYVGYYDLLFRQSVSSSNSSNFTKGKQTGTDLEKPLCASGYCAAFCVDVEREDLCRARVSHALN